MNSNNCVRASGGAMHRIEIVAHHRPMAAASRATGLREEFPMFTARGEPNRLLPEGSRIRQAPAFGGGEVEEPKPLTAWIGKPCSFRERTCTRVGSQSPRYSPGDVSDVRLRQRGDAAPDSEASNTRRSSAYLSAAGTHPYSGTDQGSEVGVRALHCAAIPPLFRTAKT